MPPAAPRPKTKPKGISAAAFLAMARKALGAPYIWGGAAGPGGDDCSGLVYWAARAVGIKNIPRTSEEQWGFVEKISRADLQPGDLVFEQWPGDQAAPGHVAIYTGNGRIEEAPAPGQKVHEVAWSPGQVSAAGGRIVGYGRIPGIAGGGAAGAIAAQTTSFLSWPGQITGFFSSAATAVDWLLQPSNWVRIIAGAGGAGAMAAGVWQLSHAGGSEDGGGMGVPRPAALPLGILLVGAGGVLLFVAFHNLPPDISNLPALLGYIQAQAKGDATGTAQPTATAPAPDTVA